MEILTPTELTDTIFDDFLEQVSEEETRRANRTRARLGRPERWFVTNSFGDQWKPPRSDETYVLIRLAFSLESGRGQEVQEAKLVAQLQCRVNARYDPVAFDLFPREVNDEAYNADFAINLGPTLKLGVAELGEVESSLGSVGTTIRMSKVEPVVIASRIGESSPTWTFRRHNKHPLIGSRMVYVVAACPVEEAEFRLTMKLTAKVVDRYGPFEVGISEKSQDKLQYSIPLQ